MENKRLHRYSLINLIWGYFAATVFVLMMILSHSPQEVEIKLGTGEEIRKDQLVIESHRVAEQNRTPHAFIYNDDLIRPSVIERGVDRVYADRLQGREINDERIIYKDRDAVIGVRDDHLTVFDGDSRIHSVDENLFTEGLHTLKRGDRGRTKHDTEIDRGILDRRLRELEGDVVDSKEYPYALRHNLIDQMKSLKKKFPNYETFKNADLTKIFSKKLLKDSYVCSVNTLSTTALKNNGNFNFTKIELPKQVQFSPVYSITHSDIDNDGDLDILMGGNLFNVKPEVGIYDASYGLFIENTSQGLKYHPNGKGFNISGEIRSLVVDKNQIWVGRNRDTLSRFTFKK